jgi:hypothetical protein
MRAVTDGGVAARIAGSRLVRGTISSLHRLILSLSKFATVISIKPIEAERAPSSLGCSSVLPRREGGVGRSLRKRLSSDSVKTAGLAYFLQKLEVAGIFASR